MSVRAVIFDAYGTLLDVHAAMRRHAGRLGAEWEAISEEWRVKQIEYTWVRTLAGPTHHRDFWHLTRAALDYVAARRGIDDAALLDDVMAAYRQLDAYPEVPDVLARLHAKAIPCAILSNGAPEMLAAAVEAAGIGALLAGVLSVEAVGAYKPDPRVYRLASTRFGAAPEEMAFVSSNPWDAFGALCFGFRVFRVNRKGLPDEYGLRARATELADLAALPDLLA
ncbi:MAG: haloacid dehalogenase type II [Acetobacteraceae bacterium]